MTHLFRLAALLLFAAPLNAQPAPGQYRVSNGVYEISYYAENIIRLSFTPDGYQRNEQVSDAVILQPVQPRHPHRYKVQGNSVAFHNAALLVNADTLGGYYRFNFQLRPGEKIYGGGERALPLDRRGYRFNLYNNPWYGYGENADNLNYSVPFFTSSRGYGLFFDNPSRGFADIGRQDSTVFSAGFSSGALQVYIILGKDYKEILRGYHRLTGTQPVPPRWAFGNLMSRFGYTSQAQADSILAKMNAAQVPVDAIIFDLFWFGDSIKGTLGNLAWMNKRKWPDPAGMIAGYKRRGIHTILVTEPFFVETSANYAPSLKYQAVDSAGRPFYLTDFYFGRGGLIDIFRKDARDWFWGFYKKQMNIGVEAWWGDLGEPEKHPEGLYHQLRDQGHRRLFAAGEVHNIYGHSWTKMLHEKYAQEFPGKRLFSLNRSGYAGSQRYGIFPWTGDVSRSWSGLRAQLPVLLGMTMSGVPYVHSDAGGFAGGEGDYELYLRWLQLAAFTPIFRPHGTALYEVEPQAFSFPSEAALMPDPWKGYARETIYKRYSLLPYNYTMAWEQAVSGSPLMAPLYYHFPEDSVAAGIGDQFMWGNSIMVAPVTEKGQAQRKYYLPAGKWYHLDERNILTGGNWQQQSLALTTYPVLIKEGSFVVMNERFASNTARYTGDTLGVFHVVSTNASAYRLFNDDGKSSHSVRTGQYELIRFSSGGRKSDRMQLSIRSDNGRYKGRPAKRVFLFSVAVDRMPARVLVNGRPATRLRKDATADCVFFDVVFTGKPVNITFSW